MVMTIFSFYLEHLDKFLWHVLFSPVHRQLQEARARVTHLFKQTNENVQVCTYEECKRVFYIAYLCLF